MDLLVDFHCHIYALYDLRKALDFAGTRQSGPVALILTERYDCAYFKALHADKINLGGDFQLKLVDENCCKLDDKLFIFRGRQYASKEGIEVLAFLASPELPDKLPAEDYCKAILEAGGLIAFSWAFGKWRGSRSILIKNLASEFGPDKVFLLDSRLRPAILPLPSAFNRLLKKGFKVFAGSDPLPLPSHQSNLASYASLFELPETEVSQINSLLLREVILTRKPLSVVGERTGVLDFLRDQVNLLIDRRRSSRQR